MNYDWSPTSSHQFVSLQDDKQPAISKKNRIFASDFKLNAMVEIKNIDGYIIYFDKDQEKLAGADLTWLDLTEADFRGRDVSCADFSYTDLSGADFTDANIENAILDGCVLVGTIFDNTNMEGTTMFGAQFELSRRHKVH